MVKLLLALVVAQLATQITHYLILKKDFGSVRASALVTLVFICLTIPFPFQDKQMMHATCLGASFVGMSDPRRLSIKQLSLASLGFFVMFHFGIHYFKGLGGALGFSAFMSCIGVYLFSSQLRKWI